jgi:hypothetical protein
VKRGGGFTKNVEKTTIHTVKKFWHGGCIQVFNGEATQRAQPKKTRNGDKKMNGLIKQSSLENVNYLASFAIGISGVALMLFVLVNGLGSGIA